MNAYLDYMNKKKLLQERHSKPHKLLRKNSDGTWSEYGPFPTYDAAYKASHLYNDGSLSWDDFKIELIEE